MRKTAAVLTGPGAVLWAVEGDQVGRRGSSHAGPGYAALSHGRMVIIMIMMDNGPHVASHQAQVMAQLWLVSA